MRILILTFDICFMVCCLHSTFGCERLLPRCLANNSNNINNKGIWSLGCTKHLLLMWGVAALLSHLKSSVNFCNRCLLSHYCHIISGFSDETRTTSAHHTLYVFTAFEILTVKKSKANSLPTCYWLCVVMLRLNCTLS